MLLHLLWLTRGRSHLDHLRSAILRYVALVLRLWERLLLERPLVVLGLLSGVYLGLLCSSVGNIVRMNLVRLLVLMLWRSGLSQHSLVLLLLCLGLLNTWVTHLLLCAHVHLSIVLLLLLGKLPR